MRIAFSQVLSISGSVGRKEVQFPRQHWSQHDGGEEQEAAIGHRRIEAEEQEGKLVQGPAALAHQGQHNRRRQHQEDDLAAHAVEVEAHPFVNMVHIQLLLEREVEWVEHQMVGVGIKK